MKAIAVLILILWAGLANAAEWLACDVPDVAQDVTSYAVIVDSQPEVIIPYALNQAQDVVLLWDITALVSVHFEVFAINSQGRRTLTSSPFDLKARPLLSSGYRIIVE